MDVTFPLDPDPYPDRHQMNTDPKHHGNRTLIFRCTYLYKNV